MFGPWVDDSHPYRARSGEVLHMIGSDVVAADTPGAIARVCVTSTVQDGNPYLMRAGYLKNLDAISDPVLRAKLRDNNWNTAGEDDPYALFPSRWLDAAFARYVPTAAPATAYGLDVARGGRDSSVLAPRHGSTFGPLHRWPGHQTPDGHSLARLVLNVRGSSKAHVFCDAIGVGAGAVDALRPRIFEKCVAVNVAEGTKIVDSTGTFSFANLRSWLAWHLRELLSPDSPTPISIAPDKQLRAELLAYRYAVQSGRFAVEGKAEIMKRIHRSPDSASALMLAAIPTSSAITYDPAMSALRAIREARSELESQEQQLW